MGEASDYLLGKNPSQIDLHWEKLSKVGSHIKLGNSGEMRGLSAIDMALWDHKARKLGVPIYDLLVNRVNTLGYSYDPFRETSTIKKITTKINLLINDPVGLAENC